MANKHYTIIDVPFIVKNGVVHETITWKFSLKYLLEKNIHRDIYILRETLDSNEIEIIII